MCQGQDDQPQELRDYIAEAEALVAEWFGRDGLETSHKLNLDALATLAALRGVMDTSPTFAESYEVVLRCLIAAFQMGRAGVHDNNGGVDQ